MPGPAVFLILSHLRDKALCDLDRTAVYNSTFYASLLERRLANSATYSVSVLSAVFRSVTAAQSSAVACDILDNSTDIYVTLFAVWYPFVRRFSAVPAGWPAPQ